MKVSVIVVTYNQAALIGRTLEAIVSQECDFDYEVVVGDDCSTDGTYEVCRAYQERYPDKIKIVRGEKNQGLQGNYFDCVEVARGEYLADCGGDDEWVDKRKLAKQVAMLDAHPEMAMCHTGWSYRNVKTGVIEVSESGSYPVDTLQGDLFLPLLRRRPTPLVHLCTAMWRREWFMRAYEEDKAMFRNRKYQVEDIPILVAMSKMGSIGYLPDVTMLYSVGSSTLSSEEDVTKNLRLAKGVVELLRYLQLKYGISDAEMATTYRERLGRIARLSFRDNDLTTLRAIGAKSREYGLRPTRGVALLTTISRIPGVYHAVKAVMNKRRKFLSRWKQR